MLFSSLCSSKVAHPAWPGALTTFTPSIRSLKDATMSPLFSWCDLFPQDATWSSVQGSWTGVGRVAEPLQSLSALSTSATIFIALLALLLHTNSMGLVSASHTSEATIQSSRSLLKAMPCSAAPKESTFVPLRHVPGGNRPVSTVEELCVLFVFSPLVFPPSHSVVGSASVI